SRLDHALDRLAQLGVSRVVPQQDPDQPRAVGAVELNDHRYVGDQVGELGGERLPGAGPGEDAALRRDLIPLQLRSPAARAAPGRRPDPAPATRAVLDQEASFAQSLPEAHVDAVRARADLADHGCPLELHQSGSLANSAELTNGATGPPIKREV